LQNFGSIFNILFVTLQCIWQDFVIVWQNTPGAVYHPAMACLPQWVLLNSVARSCNTTQILQKWCNLTCVCAWVSEGFYPEGH